MKKFFTLIAVACMALAANAKENLDLPNPWGGSCVLDGTTYTFDGSWAGAGLWLGTEVDGVQTWYDASAYDYLYVAYANHTGGDVNVGINYNHWEKAESWGDVFTTVTKPIDMPEGYVAIKLDKTSIADGGKTYAEEIRQLQLQDAGSAASVTIKEVAFVTEAELEEIKAGTAPQVKVKEFALPGDNGVVEMSEGEDNSGWYASSWIGLENLADQDYKTFVIEIASADAPFQVLAQDWPSGDMSIQQFEATAAPVTAVFPIGEGGISGLGQFALQNLNVTDTYMDPASGKEVSWYDVNKVVVTRAYLTSEDLNPASVQNVNVTVNNNVMYNIAGQRISKANGIYIMNGKKYLAK